MKNLTKLLFAFLITVESFAQQAIELNSKSLKLPQYANTATLNSAITTPQTGMMVYNQGTVSPNYYNGSSWQSFSTTPTTQYTKSISFLGVNSTTSNSTTNFTFTVPANITKIWVEAWGGGDAGHNLPYPTYYYENNLLYKGRDGGNYLSAIITVVPAEVLTIKVGNGGNSSSSNNGSYGIGGATSIFRNATIKILETGSYPNTFFLLTDNTTNTNGILNFVQGGVGSQSQENTAYIQTTQNTVRSISRGDGGASFPNQSGGKGCTINIVNDQVISGLNGAFNFSGGAGATPGGGGGVGFNTGANSGGSGMIILRW